MISFLHNRQIRTIESLDPNTSVLDYLRDHLFLKGTKEGCASGDCGACTVVAGELKGEHIRYQTLNACITPLVSMHGKQLITIEDLSDGETLHSAQNALVKQHGSQCGFCTPGIIMSMFTYHKNCIQPTREGILNALSGNLCRCTGYRPIIDATFEMFQENDEDAISRHEQESVRTLELLNQLPNDITLSCNGKGYFAPRTSDELAGLCLQYPDARLLAGGTDLFLEVTQSLRDLDTIIDVSRVGELRTVVDAGKSLEIGASVTYSDCSELLVKHYADLRELLDRFGSLQIRNAGTLGGNIANASPVADMAAALIALSTELVLRCGDERRTIPLEDYFIRYNVTALKASEFIERIIIPKTRPGFHFRVYKISKRLDDDISTVCAAFHLRIDSTRIADTRVVFGGMADIPKRAIHCEQALLGAAWDERTINLARQALNEDFTPITDLRASADYRMGVSKNMLTRLFIEINNSDTNTRVSRYAITCQNTVSFPSSKYIDKKDTVGMRVPHDSATKHVSGKAVYTDDHPAYENMLYAGIGLSEHARARIINIDLKAVLESDGVVDILTLDDVPGSTDIGPVFAGDPLLAGDEAEFWGQPLFAVAASSQRLAQKAARLAKVKYEVLNPVLNIEDALQRKYFVRPPLSFQTGDPESAISGAPHRLHGELHIGSQEHFYLEGQVSLAVPAEDGGMLLYTSSQHPSMIQQTVARVLGVPMNHVTVDVRRMGGAFGGKETQAAQWACIAALLARKTGRPVKCRLPRADDMVATGKRHPFLCRHSVGFDDDGHILGLETELSANCGFSPDLSDAVVDRAMLHADNGYYLANARITGNRCKTNTVSNTAFRGFGGPQAMVSIEGIIDDISRYLGKDPLDVRKINLYGRDGGCNITHYGQAVEQLVLEELINRLEKSSNYRARREDVIRFNRENKVFRKGIALTPVKFGISFSARPLNQAGALVHVYSDGSIHLNHGGTEMGQGLFIKVAQVVAQEFGVDLDKVIVSAARTDKVPNTSPTAASASSDLNGMAARNAAREIKKRMTASAAANFGVTETDVHFEDNHIHAGSEKLGFAELAQLCHLQRVSLSATGFYRTPEIQFARETGKGQPYYYYANGAAVSEVLIDTLTGEYKVLGVDILHDTGHSINPAVDTGQIEGGFIQGMGWLTTEELIWDDEGRLLTRSPSSYKIPAIGDTPVHFNVELMPDNPNRKATIYHSKGVGEPPLMLAISVWAALRDAVASLADYRYSPRLDTPATPERVLGAVHETMSMSHEKLD